VSAEYQSIATKRQYAQSRLNRAENKKLDVQVQAQRILDDLKIHLMIIKEQIKTLIQDAHETQQTMLLQDAADVPNSVQGSLRI